MLLNIDGTPACLRICGVKYTIAFTPQNAARAEGDEQMRRAERARGVRSSASHPRYPRRPRWSRRPWPARRDRRPRSRSSPRFISSSSASTSSRPRSRRSARGPPSSRASRSQRGLGEGEDDGRLCQRRNKREAEHQPPRSAQQQRCQAHEVGEQDP